MRLLKDESGSGPARPMPPAAAVRAGECQVGRAALRSAGMYERAALILDSETHALSELSLALITLSLRPLYTTDLRCTASGSSSMRGTAT